MTVHLVRRNARSMPWAGEEALAPLGEQDSTGHDIGPRTSKSSSPSEEPGNKIFKGYCGAKGSRDSGPFHIKPKAHTEEEEMPEDEQRESRLLGYIAEDRVVLSRPKSCPRQTKITEGKSATPPEAVLLSIPKEVPSPVGQP